MCSGGGAGVRVGHYLPHLDGAEASLTQRNRLLFAFLRQVSQECGAMASTASERTRKKVRKSERRALPQPPVDGAPVDPEDLGGPGDGAPRIGKDPPDGLDPYLPK